jgi:FKBP-type peptidyl-prolyl cis-trans isomerase
MRRPLQIALVASAVALLATGLRAGEEAAEGEPTVTLQTEADRLSYALGLNIGSNMAQQKLNVDPEILAAGLKDGLENNEPLLSQAEFQQVMQNFEQRMRQQMQEERAAREAELEAAGAANRKQGAAFLAENKKKDDVETTESGLQYKVLKAGDGPQVEAGDRVKVHYVGKTLDGEVFDSSYERGEPAPIDLDQVIKGWKIGLQLMQVGDKYRLFIPSDLGYGEQGRPPVIPPSAVLIFDVEVLEVLPEAPAQTPAE